MAVKTHTAFLEQCLAVKAAMLSLRTARSRMEELIDHHNARGFSDAGDTPKPSYINEDADGNVDGTDFTRSDYISAVTLFLEQMDFFENAAVTQGDYSATMHVIVDA